MSFDRVLDESEPFRICFVCTGNICRSPMAEVVLRAIAAREGYGQAISVGSAGTGDWHVGEPADPRTVAALTARGYDGTGHRARQFDPAWFDDLDLVVVFDRGQERIITEWAGTEANRGKVAPLMSFDHGQSQVDIQDPYYSDASMFDAVLRVIEHADTALFRQLRPGIRPGA